MRSSISACANHAPAKQQKESLMFFEFKHGGHALPDAAAGGARAALRGRSDIVTPEQAGEDFDPNTMTPFRYLLDEVGKKEDDLLPVSEETVKALDALGEAMIDPPADRRTQCRLAHPPDLHLLEPVHRPRADRPHRPGRGGERHHGGCARPQARGQAQGGEGSPQPAHAGARARLPLRRRASRPPR